MLRGPPTISPPTPSLLPHPQFNASIIVNEPTWFSTHEAAGPLSIQQNGSSKGASGDQFSPQVPLFHRRLRGDTVTAHFDISFPAIQTQPKDSNPSQLPQCVVSLAAVFMTSSRRTFPRRAATWHRESPPRGPAEAARLRVAVATNKAVSGGGARGTPVGNPSASKSLWHLGAGSGGTKGRRSSVAGADLDPICPSFQVSPMAETKACGEFRFSGTVVVVVGPS
ncbi:uncharacterized protein LOC120609239 [Pteropus medius]|uniref:uncharacterized protein LOC120609239 n=1 Tax=Pteropus vampyrus TaxID=132908 RepID=UPI00196AC9CD|nr:uncharacterized protein LOC120609239 [Pteropus giganteus]